MSQRARAQLGGGLIVLVVVVAAAVRAQESDYRVAYAVLATVLAAYLFSVFVRARR
ncbi:MAG TPA: hypothetical protein VGW38_08810 [Chloroflexota bacterium]|nr:hypothetical protein [Chloroflexota bacterium]